jgi:hypothetical protein
MIHLWDAARLWLWIHPWWHAAILFGSPVVISTVLGLWGLRHSKEANRLNREANHIREEQKTSVAEIAELQAEGVKRQTELNKLQGERNESLGQIAVGVKKDLTLAEKNAAKLRKYIGEWASVTNPDGTRWSAMGAVIAEVNADNILQLFMPAGNWSSRATGTCVQCDKLHIVETAKGSCKVQITVLERYGPTIEYGEAKSWAERHGTSTSPRPRGPHIFNTNYRKAGAAAKRGIYIYAPIAGNPDYSLVTFENMVETGVHYCGKREVEIKFAVLQLEWYDEGYRYDGGSGGSSEQLFLFTRT